jgi:hypothetical protein
MLLHPLFLWGLAGAAVPILIHLLARRRARRVPFPSLRLLQAAQRKRRTLARLQRPLSLLLRILAICLIALALATPVVGRLPSWLPVPRTRAVAVVLDDTLSMTAPVEGQTPFGRAKEFAGRLLAALGPEDRVALIRASSPGDVRWVRPDSAREELARAEPTASGAKLGPALLGAAEALREASAPNRAALLVTDFQASAWQDPPPSGTEFGGMPALVCDVGDKRASNVAVTSIEPLTPAAVIGRPVRLQATATASFPGKAPPKPQKVVLQLLVGERAVAASAQEVGAEAPATAQFSFVPEKAEDIVARVGLMNGPFGMGLDDVRWCTVRVRPPVRVVVASGGNAGRYVAAVLNPFNDPAKTGMEVRLVDPSAVSAALGRESTDLVVLANCPALDARAVEALNRHAASGGGLLVLLGDGADAKFLSERLVPALTGDRSLQIGAVDKAPPEAPFALAEVDTARAPLSAFANPRAGDLGALQFTKVRRIKVGAQARVLARFDNGAPAIVEWRAGRGRLILFNTSPDGSWGAHIRSPAYVPLLHRLATHLARPARPSIADVIVGERPVIADADPPPVEVTLKPPSGDERAVPVQDGVVPEVKVPGEYHVHWGTFDLAFAANADSRESDLTRTDEASAREALAPAHVAFVRPDARPAELTAMLPERADLSVELLLAALAVLLVEAVVSIIRRGPEEGVGPARSTAT